MEELFDNKYGMKFHEALDLIKQYFNHNVPQFDLKEEYNENTGYWGIKYSYKATVIFISSSRGYLEYEITNQEKDLSLLQFEPQMQNIEVASERNIRFTLGVISKFVQTIKD